MWHGTKVFGWGFVLLWLPLGNAAYAETAAEQPPPQPLFFVNISERFLSDLLREPVTEQTNVIGTIVGNPVRGQAITHGRVYLDCVQHDESARFWILFAGKTTARSVAYRDPARIHSTTLTRFITGKEFTYANDGKLRREPVRVMADTDRYTRCIESVLPGVRGMVVRRAAANRLEQYRGAISRDADRLARTQVTESFERIVQEHMNRLEDRLSRIHETFQQSAQERDYSWRVATSDQGILISAFPRDSALAGRQVTRGTPSLARADSLVEVWQHDRWTATDPHSLDRSLRVLRFVLRVFAGTTELPRQWEENIRRVGSLDSSVVESDAWSVVHLFERPVAAE